MGDKSPESKQREKNQKAKVSSDNKQKQADRQTAFASTPAKDKKG
jgi:hypothetical protein